jgi:hypothetical protein
VHGNEAYLAQQSRREEKGMIDGGLAEEQSRYGLFTADRHSYVRRDRCIPLTVHRQGQQRPVLPLQQVM